MYWTVEYIRDGLELTRSVKAESLGKAWALAFELEDDPSVEVTDVYMADQGEYV